VLRDWVRAEIRAADPSGLPDDAYEHLLSLSADLKRAEAPAPWDIELKPSRSSRRSRAGAFYTPPALVDWLLDAALDPAIADARARRPGEPDAVLALRICDPACGSGRFLAAAARRLAAALARDRAAPGEPTSAHHHAAMRDVLRRCIFGVDIDDIAVELCRASLAGLAVGTDDPAAVARALTEHIREGDALLGATPELIAPGSPTCRRADAWCASFFDAADAPSATDSPARPRRFFHWFFEFPGECGGEGGGGFDAVVGNPPFLNQLQSATAVDRGVRALLRARFGGAVRGYADTAAAFVLLATGLVREGGRVGLVLPRSLLAVEHAGRVRARVLEAAAPTAMWVAPSGAFAAASVATCAVALHVGGARRGELRRAKGTGFVPLAPLELDVDELTTKPSWSHLLADADGIPNIVVRSSRTIGDLADATADFRDQYYGLRGLIIDSPDGHPRRPKLITSGLIAPLESLWGRITTRIHKQKWLHPRVDLDALDAAARSDPEMQRLAAWAKSRLVPKLLLATQTRVLEVLPDPEGELLPCVPVITVTPKGPARLWYVAAALSSPVASAIALTRYGGAGLSAGAIKLGAKQVLALPAPDDGPAFDEAAELIRAAFASRVDEQGFREFAAAISGAMAMHDLPSAERETVLAWWTARAPAPVKTGELSESGRSPRREAIPVV